MLVLQFANGGNLRNYLQSKQKDGIYKNSWAEIIRISTEITNGLKYLHDRGTIHRDLHSKNILMNDDKALIADFGISKNELEMTVTGSNIAGMPAYIEPQCLINENGKRDRKSDIYSLGVLLWELTSGVPPFHNFGTLIIVIKISKNEREKVVPNTPTNYVNLYKKCWSTDPNNRPELKDVLFELKKLAEEETIEFITNEINNGPEQSPMNLM
ncbi:kinase-like domain-containing protein [Gigaspora rosea]|uniref:Kinase-like domain-containing protein n=1 Tax=Gigaspora rosea TaxID=44941 RepID=A0A397U2C1_9GLOM|nr:kinase-like domain-containing protein [Gigaspora rosea]